MIINFKKIVIENFMSFGQAEIDLDNAGYTLVNGVNENPDDNAKSNGSGKSSIFEAISYALTGETIRGSKDVVNIHGSDGAFVELNFDVDNSEYKIIRTKDHSKYKTNLKIFINGEDKSGKGIRDSEKLLSEYLPDLTSSLLGSVIVLGQGLPQRFTNNSPSGRKEVLEKLSKSDFMIDDLKNRISSRLSTLKAAVRHCEDTALAINVNRQSYQRQIDDNELKLANLSSSDTLEKLISMLEANVLDCSIKINTWNSELEGLLTESKSANDSHTELIKKSNDEANNVKYKYDTLINDSKSEFQSAKDSIDSEFSGKLNEIKSKWDSKINDLRVEYASKNSELTSKNNELTKLKNIKDVCPTCGHKLDGVEKPDTSQLELEISKLSECLTKITADGKEMKSKCDDEMSVTKSEYDKLILELNNKYSEIINDLQSTYDKAMADGKEKYDKILDESINKINDVDSKIKTVRESISIFSTKKSNYESELITAKSNLSNLEATRKASEDAISNAKLELDKLDDEEKLNESEKDTTNAHLDIVNKMSTVITRDFRGYLLKNIIDFINKKAKEYSIDIFDTDKIDFSLDGNNIVIKYDGKDYESLSGGEKQKIDLIVQFSIRDMLCKFLNFSSNILVLDEIADNVDSVGAEKLFNMISKRLTDVQSIFIVSHHTDFELPVDRQIIVTKGLDKISKIVYN